MSSPEQTKCSQLSYYKHRTSIGSSSSMCIRQYFLIAATLILPLGTVALSVSRSKKILLERSTTSLSASRRNILGVVPLMVGVGVSNAKICLAGEFTPGGTLVDRAVGVQVGNLDASLSRKADNANVLFALDHYFKFGVAAPWIPPGGVDFPKTMPFVPSQQRYDNLKKYGDRIKRGISVLVDLKKSIQSGSFRDILPPDAPEYQLRPMGLLANGMMASENTGATNELLLARWYVNEIYLDIGEIQKASNEKEAMQRYEAMLKAIDSYFGLLNRIITPKVGEQFQLQST